MARLLTFACLILMLIVGCPRSEPVFVVGEKAAKIEKKILVALFKASEQKIDLKSCESHTFSTVGEFLAEIFSSGRKFQKISLQCPKEENGKLFCEFNIDHGKDNTLVRFVYDVKRSQLLKTFKPQCIRVP
ncbi:MAG: hypothetical protein MI799_03080 [Desulfobacterales bacterium]|nr:hypothetical protein [Desulfobacterales bacterium]